MILEVFVNPYRYKSPPYRTTSFVRYSYYATRVVPQTKEEWITACLSQMSGMSSGVFKSQHDFPPPKPPYPLRTKRGHDFPNREEALEEGYRVLLPAPIGSSTTNPPAPAGAAPVEGGQEGAKRGAIFHTPRWDDPNDVFWRRGSALAALCWNIATFFPSYQFELNIMDASRIGDTLELYASSSSASSSSSKFNAVYFMYHGSVTSLGRMEFVAPPSTHQEQAGSLVPSTPNTGATPTAPEQDSEAFEKFATNLPLVLHPEADVWFDSCYGHAIVSRLVGFNFQAGGSSSAGAAPPASPSSSAAPSGEPRAGCGAVSSDGSRVAYMYASFYMIHNSDNRYKHTCSAALSSFQSPLISAMVS